MEHKTVSATYALFDITDGGEVLLESASADNPLRLVTGLNLTPFRAFDELLAALSAGEKYSLVLPPDEAFGVRDETRVLAIDKKDLSPGGSFDETRVFPGAVLPLQNEEGQIFRAQVIDVQDVSVIVDFNHPLAGKTLRLDGEVLDTRAATDEEEAACGKRHCGGCHRGDCDNGGCRHDCCGHDCE
ncbi:MAG: FKBP-type peptidyl-prolyl cis-trans isomerase [Prevotella sp.]|nr:FKBP-type peptidyl-prolyl cis-trans isomerase [Prevotella sp.]